MRSPLSTTSKADGLWALVGRHAFDLVGVEDRVNAVNQAALASFGRFAVTAFARFSSLSPPPWH